jgi:hypothetical protein
VKLASTGQHRRPETWTEKAARAARRVLATEWPPAEPEPVAAFPSLPDPRGDLKEVPRAE